MDLGYVFAMILGTQFLVIMGILIGDFTDAERKKASE